MLLVRTPSVQALPQAVQSLPVSGLPGGLPAAVNQGLPVASPAGANAMAAAAAAAQAAHLPGGPGAGQLSVGPQAALASPVAAATPSQVSLAMMGYSAVSGTTTTTTAIRPTLTLTPSVLNSAQLSVKVNITFGRLNLFINALNILNALYVIPKMYILVIVFHAFVMIATSLIWV